MLGRPYQQGRGILGMKLWMNNTGGSRDRKTERPSQKKQTNPKANNLSRVMTTLMDSSRTAPTKALNSCREMSF